MSTTPSMIENRRPGESLSLSNANENKENLVSTEGAVGNQNENKCTILSNGICEQHQVMSSTGYKESLERSWWR